LIVLPESQAITQQDATFREQAQAFDPGIIAGEQAIDIDIVLNRPEEVGTKTDSILIIMFPAHLHPKLAKIVIQPVVVIGIAGALKINTGADTQ
jgi:hypothetical protein